MYLVRLHRPDKTAAHLWDDNTEDTLCRMYSTGGLTHRRGYEVTRSRPPYRICHNCKKMANRKDRPRYRAQDKNKKSKRGQLQRRLAFPEKQTGTTDQLQIVADAEKHI